MIKKLKCRGASSLKTRFEFLGGNIAQPRSLGRWMLCNKVAQRWLALR